VFNGFLTAVPVQGLFRSRIEKPKRNITVEHTGRSSRQLWIVQPPPLGESVQPLSEKGNPFLLADRPFPIGGIIKVDILKKGKLPFLSLLIFYNY
jgi:hypothetical protein